MDKAIAVVAAALVLLAAFSAYSFYQVQTLRSEMAGVAEEGASKEDVQSIAESVQQIQEAIANLSQAVAELNTKISQAQGLSEAVQNLSSSIDSLREYVREEIARLKEELRYPLTLTDALGRSVTFTSPPERVVCTAPSATEIVFAVGAGDLVVGVDQFSNYPPEVVEGKESGRIAVVGGYSTINVEKVVELRPDVVFMTPGVQEKYVKALENLGVKVFVLWEGSIGDIYRSILTAGLITNHFDEAASLVQKISERIAATHAAVMKYLNATGQPPLKVYYELSLDYWTVGSGSFINDVIALAGGVNIFANESMPYFQASPEAIIEADPDAIITTGMGGWFGPPQQIINKIVSRPGWGNITAVKEGRVYVLNGTLEDILVRPGPRIAAAVEVMARVLYPQAFGLSEVPNIINDTVAQEWGIDLGTG